MQLMSDDDDDEEEEQDGMLNGDGSDLPSSSAADSDESNESGELAVPSQLCCRLT